MTSYFDELWGLVEQMGAEKVTAFELKRPPRHELVLIDPLVEGVEIKLSDLESPTNSGGLLSVQGNHVLVYIPDQGGSLASVLRNPANGKKFHVSHCKTLTAMQSIGKENRYVATDDTSGIFNLTGSMETEHARGALTVCRNCLKFLNYQDYKGRASERSRIYRQFDLAEFFSTYSSLFKRPYGRASGERPRLSQAREPDAAYTTKKSEQPCQKCGVSLAGNGRLIVTVDSSGGESQVVFCKDCHRRQNWAVAEPVLQDDMRVITKKRKEQGLIDAIDNWQEAYDLADPTFHGLMKIYERQEWPIPEIGYPLTDSEGVVLDVELGLAWENRRYGVVASEDEKLRCDAPGWRVLTLGEALMESGEDG